MDEWIAQAKEQEAKSIFCAVFVHRQIPSSSLISTASDKPVTCELQLFRDQDLASSWDSRINFKLDAS